MRTDNSIKNSISSVLANLISIIVSFFARTFFIRILGAELLGLNSLLINILSVLSIFELGLGNAIVFHLYKPIKDNNEEYIIKLMNFYKKSYHIIGLVILLLGILIMPFLRFFISDLESDVNVYFAFLLFLLCTVISYFLSYKRNLIIANQKNYIISLIHAAYLIIMNVLQIIIIYLTRNYYYFLIVKLMSVLMENIIITIMANKLYPYIRGNSKKTIDKTLEKDIFSRIKALFFHKIGTVIVLSTDNIIISYFFGVITVGIYSNYYMVIDAIDTLFGQIITSTTASVGNMLISNDKKVSYTIFNRMRFLNFWISCLCGISLFLLLQPFIRIWIGDSYLLSISIIFIIVFNFFQKMMRKIYITFKDSAGIWREDKFIPLIEAILNIIFSIVLLKFFGLIGVFLGTTLSGMIVWFYGYPIFVYKKLFDRSYYQYFKETILYIILFLTICFITYAISCTIVINNPLLKLIINGFIALAIPNIILVIIYRKTDNFKYFISLIKKIIGKILRKDIKT